MNEFIKSDLYKKLNEHTIAICDELIGYSSWMDLIDHKSRLIEMLHKLEHMRATACQNLNEYEVNK